MRSARIVFSLYIYVSVCQISERLTLNDIKDLIFFTYIFIFYYAWRYTYIEEMLSKIKKF